LDFRHIGARSDRERENCRENSLSSWFSGFWGFILFWVFFFILIKMNDLALFGFKRF
jgi:hypothetical protein